MKHAMQPNQKLTVSSVVDVEPRSWFLRQVREDQACLSKRVEEAYRRPNYRFLFRRKPPRARCDDLFEEIFLQGRAAASRYQPQPQWQLGPWIFTIAANTVSNFTRANLVPLGDMPKHDVESNARTVEWLERHAIAQWLEQAIAPLARVQAEVRILATPIDGTRQSDIANILKMRLYIVKPRLHRARQKKLFNALLRRETRRLTGTHE